MADLKNLNLTDEQILAAEIFATNDIHKLTIEEIAKRVGVSERTLYRWKQDENFIAHQNSISERVMEDFLSETYNALKEIVRSGKSDQAKLKAVELVLKNRGKLTDVHKIDATIEDTRSTDAIRNDIEELRKQLGEI